MQVLVERVVAVMHLELLLQLVLATVLGGAIGLERELAGKAAGLRTNILICVGATLFTHVSILMIAIPGTNLDASRIPAQIVSGVGFIGAGAILHARGSVTGLTSAATIWVVAAIGMSLGAHAYVEGVGTALLVLLVLQGLRSLERWIGRAFTRSHLLIHAKPEPQMLTDLEELAHRTGLVIERTQSRLENVDLVLELDLRGPKRLHDQLLIGMLHHPGVRTVSTGE